MYAVTFLAANRDVMDNLRTEGLQCLHQQGGGCLSIHVEVTPNTDHLTFAYSHVDTLDCGFNIREWSGWKGAGMQKGLRLLQRGESASDESLRDEWRQV